MSDEKKFFGWFDGASRSNPGEAGAGALIEDEEGAVVWESAEYLGVRTNNEAEYAAVLALLREAGSRGMRGIKIRGDSRLVVMQTSGKWKVKEPRLMPLAREAASLLAELGASIEWVPREQNSRADALSNRAIDEKK